MSNIQFVAVRAAMSMLFIGVFMHFASANVDKSLSTIEKEVLKDRIETLYSPVDLRYTEEVHEVVDMYIRQYRKGSEKILGLSERFFPIYEAELSKMGLPKELKYLSVVESGLRPNVVSKAGAVGLWQFMRTTSNIYGLTSNSVVDERRDPVRSTQAASAYLKDLYLQFGDWTLALAAYNCGPGNVRKALRRSNKDEFWALKSFLPKETRRYIPKYVAISYIMSYSHVHGLNPLLDYDINTLATVRIFDYSTLKEIAQQAGLDYEVVKQLNPAFLKNYIPKSSKGYLLTLPETNMYNLLALKGGWDNLITTSQHSKSLQETYYRYGAMKRQLEELAPIQNSHSANLQLKSTDLNDRKIVMNTRTVTPIEPREKTVLVASGKYYPLLPQQSLTDMAKKHGLSLTELLRLNEINIHQLPPPGTMIRVK